jgi:hypothetical protein
MVHHSSRSISTVHIYTFYFCIFIPSCSSCENFNSSMYLMVSFLFVIQGCFPWSSKNFSIYLRIIIYLFWKYGTRLHVLWLVITSVIISQAIQKPRINSQIHKYSCSAGFLFGKNKSIRTQAKTAERIRKGISLSNSIKYFHFITLYILSLHNLLFYILSMFSFKLWTLNLYKCHAALSEINSTTMYV